MTSADPIPTAAYWRAIPEENEALRARVESQKLVIADLRQELENACRRIVELERGRGGDGA